MVGPRNSILCMCSQNVTAVTIKGIAKSDGETVWEYGPGSMWRHHYGVDAITGIVPNLSAILDKYAIGAYAGNQFVSAGNRNTATLLPNVAEPLTITKLNSLNGTVIESAALQGMFCDEIYGATYSGSVNIAQGITIAEAAALSGGDYVIVGRRVPYIEFVDFTSNTATKDYILHAHNQQGGNVYVRTRTSSEVITIPYNSTAAAVETLFEATADCTAATATGGPWPHVPIEIEVTWSASSGDIEGIKTDATFATDAPGTGSSNWQWDSTPGEWVYISDTCTVGTASPPTVDGTFDGEPAVSGCVVSGGGSTRSVQGMAATYDTGTGAIVNSVGAIFGRSATVTLTRLIASTTPIPAILGAESAGIQQIVSGPDNSVVLVANPQAGTVNVGIDKARTIEAWTVGTTWAVLWRYYTNTKEPFPVTYLNAGQVSALQVEAGYVICSFPRQTFAGGGTACGALIEIDGGAVTEYDNSVVSSAYNGNNLATIGMHEDDPATKIIADYERTFTDADYSAVKFNIHFEGSQVWNDGTEYLLGVSPYATTRKYVFADSAAIYSVIGPPFAQINSDPAARNPPLLAGTNARAYVWTFYTPIYSRFGSATEFRFRFAAPGFLTKYSSWLAWNASTSDIATALLAVFGENTSIVSNVGVYVFGTPASIANTDASWLEQGLQIRFAGSASVGNPENYISPAYLSSRSSITVELRNVANYATPGIAAFSPTDGSVIWTRPFGTADTTTISGPETMWIRGDFVYAYGQIVDSEL